MYLKPVMSCKSHMPPLYVMRKGDCGNPEARTSFSAFRKPSIKVQDIFISIVSLNGSLWEDLRSWWLKNTHPFEGFVYSLTGQKKQWWEWLIFFLRAWMNDIVILMEHWSEGVNKCLRWHQSGVYHFFVIKLRNTQVSNAVIQALTNKMYF